MSTEVNIFEAASRQKLMFPSVKGQLNVEQLWDLPLTSKSALDLDSIAKGVNAQLKELAEESFVSPTANSPQRASLTLKLSILKHIIGVRMAENEAEANRKTVAARKQLLLGALEEQQIEAIKKMTPEQLKAEIAALG